MEPLRHRRNSASSIHSQSDSSIANVQCSAEHTHAIVQRQKDNKVVLIPLERFVNFGKTVKVNEIATYKEKEDSRKADRGKVLIFGTEELCVEQLQVLMEEIGNENEEPSTISANAISSSSSTTAKDTSNKKRFLNMTNESCNKKKKVNNQSGMSNQLLTSKNKSQSSKADRRFDSRSSISINVTPVVTKTSRKTKDQVKRKLFTDSNRCSVHDDSHGEVFGNFLEDIHEIHDIGKENQPPNDTVGDESYSKSTNDNHYQSDPKTPANIASSIQSDAEEIFNSPEDDKNTSSSLSDISADLEDVDSDQVKTILLKKYIKTYKKYQQEKHNTTILRAKVDYYKKNYVPMPDARARAWFSRVAKVLNRNLSANDILEHSKRIGFSNPNLLLGCIGDNGTETTRKIIRNMYSKEVLLTKVGNEAVSKERHFVEVHHGLIADHPFNESINGVFRQAKSYSKKSKEKKAVSKASNVSQRKISDMLPKKKLALNVTSKVMKTFDDPCSSSNEDNEI
ncbi:unnamed protein product [Rotaria socialis]|uniref:Uncharacterized protein n=1 Tax=Rotaria socialis TaxID=392032 RepID=A0A818A3E2_9BILA|nr:unnamed protein product [Rotaria socialis]